MGQQNLSRSQVRWIVFGLISAFIAMGVYFFPGDDLKISNLTSDLPYEAKWEIPALAEVQKARLNEILNQTFFYSGEGGQSYVFLSADQRYVLKFFKFRRFRPSFFVKMLPDIALWHSYRNKHIAKREQKLVTAFTGYKLAYDLHRQESGLIFIQLNPSDISRKVTLVDKRHFKRVVNLKNVSYIIQEKGEVLSAALATLLDQRDLERAKQRLDQLFDLYLSEYRKGIYDQDHGVMHNIGVVEDRLFHLDAGKFIQDEHMKQPEYYQKDLTKIALKVQSWIDRKYPQYSQALNQSIEKKLSQLFGKQFTLPITTS